MSCTLTEKIVMNEAVNTSVVSPIVGRWRKSSKLGGEFAQYLEFEVIEFNGDGSGVWSQCDNSGFFKPEEDRFTYRVQGRRVIVSYASVPNQCSVLDYRVADGHLILIDNYSVPGEYIEVYDSCASRPPKQLKMRD